MGHAALLAVSPHLFSALPRAQEAPERGHQALWKASRTVEEGQRTFSTFPVCILPRKACPVPSSQEPSLDLEWAGVCLLQGLSASALLTLWADNPLLCELSSSL